MSLNNIHPTAIVDPNAKLGENRSLLDYRPRGYNW